MEIRRTLKEVPRLPTSPSAANSRRSQRVVIQIRVTVIRSGDADFAMSEDTNTLIVNSHGALVALAMNVHPGETLTLRNLMTREEQPIRVVHLGKKPASKREVAIEFINAVAHFWHIDFPPADWTAVKD